MKALKFLMIIACGLLAILLAQAAQAHNDAAPANSQARVAGR